MHSVRVAFAAVLVCILIFDCAPAQQQTCSPSPLAFIAHTDCALSCLAYLLSLCPVSCSLLMLSLQVSVKISEQMGLGVYKIFQKRAPDDLDRGWAGLLMFYPEALDSVHSYTCVLNLQSVLS